MAFNFSFVVQSCVLCLSVYMCRQFCYSSCYIHFVLLLSLICWEISIEACYELLVGIPRFVYFGLFMCGYDLCPLRDFVWGSGPLV